MRVMLHVCDIFATEYDFKFNTTKSAVIRVGPRSNVDCAPLMLAGQNLMYVITVKYLGVYLVAAKHFKCSMDHTRMKFYRAFNCIYAKSRAANSELISVELFRSYCLPLILYATEALDLSKRVLSMPDNCINRDVAKIFSVNDRQSIQYITLNLNLRNIEVVIESRKKKKFIDKLSQ